MDSKKQKIIISIILIILILFCSFIITKIFVESATVEDDLTYCENMCYPNEVEAEILNNVCICLPEIKDHLTEP